MNFAETIWFYLMIGGAVAIAQALNDRPVRPLSRLAGVLGAWLFWPLFLPLFLTARTDRHAGNQSKFSTTELSAADPLAAAIEQVQRELDAALASLDGWAENVLQRKPDRLRELRTALSVQAQRIRQMQLVVGSEQAELSRGRTELTTASSYEQNNARVARSQRARQQNMKRLADVCRRAEADLLGTLAWIRELVSMIQLARFTGAPPARAEELVAQIAAAVESISSLSAAEAHEPANVVPQIALPVGEGGPP